MRAQTPPPALRLPRRAHVDPAARDALQELADHYATRYSDTPQLQSARRDLLDTEAKAARDQHATRLARHRALTAAQRDTTTETGAAA